VIAAVAGYLERVAAEATDRPRALAAGILAEALRRSLAGEQAPFAGVEAAILGAAAGEAAEDTAAEIVYEIGSIMVELRQRFPDALPSLPGAG
jgi:hypothetical protein